MKYVYAAFAFIIAGLIGDALIVFVPMIPAPVWIIFTIIFLIIYHRQTS